MCLQMRALHISDLQPTGRWRKTWATNWRETLPTKEKETVFHAKGLKKAGTQPCGWRESSWRWGKKMITTGECWPRSSPRSSLSQVALLLLLLHPQPTEAQRSQGILWIIRPPRKEEGTAVRAQESRVTCRFASVSTAAGSWTSTTSKNMYIVFSLRLFWWFFFV